MSYYEPPDVDDGPPEQEEPPEQPAELVHVHDCTASFEKRPCQFDWAGHDESTRCACGPTLDETNLSLNGTVFVMHRGVC